MDLILGGPPCQGFSYAGWRDPNDKRNQLFKEFVTLVSTIQPYFFVMENVLGILTMRGGDAIKEIVQAFADVGYYVNAPFKVNAADYGVPQRRKRVIIIGCKDDIKITPNPLFSEDDMFLPNPVTVREAIGNLPPIEDGGGEEEMEWNPTSMSLYDKLMQKQITFDEFYERKKNGEE